MSYIANQKQALAHKAFMSDGFKRGVLFWGRQCFAPDTLIRTAYGLVPIADLMVGDEVLSYGNKPEYKPVTAIREYGVDESPKPMLKYRLYGEVISSTYDHPFWYDGQYVPIYQLAWREMASSQRQKLELLCQRYGSPLDYSAIRRLQSGGDETGQGFKRLSTDSDGWNDGQSPQSSGRNLDSQPQTDSQPQERAQGRQQSGELGVDDPQGEYPTLSRQWLGGRQTRRELRYAHSDRNRGQTDSGLSEGQSQGSKVGTGSSTIAVLSPGESRFNQGYSARPELEILAVEPVSLTYSIEVADNHNYCVTAQNILVKNSGKTWFATQHAWISAIVEQGRYLIVFSTYKQAHEVVWRQYLSLIPPELIYKKNEQDLIIELHYLENTPLTLPNGEKRLINHDKSKPRSIVQLLGSDQADSHRGLKANGIIFDEYADQKPDNFSAVYEPMFTTTGGWAIFMGTPRGYNHFYDLVLDAQAEESWFYQTATWRDSPYVNAEAIARARRDAERKGTLSTFLQEYELEFRSVQGAVFPQFNRDIHVIKPADIPEELSIYSGIDYGWHTTACLFIGIDKDQNWWVFDEVYGREEILKDIMPRIRDKLGDKRLIMMVGDSQAKDANETMAKEGFPVVPVSKLGPSTVPGGSIAHGIDLIREKLRPRIQLIGEPKPTIFFSSVCKNVIQEVESYKYPEEKENRDPGEVPQKENDHGPDALRYLVLQLKYGIDQEEKPLEFEMEKSVNQYGLL